MKILNAVASGALVFSIAAFPQFSIANTNAYAYAEASTSGNATSDTQTGASGQASQAGTSVSTVAGPVTGQAAGNATATEGSLGVSASSSVNSLAGESPSGASFSSRARASWSDALTIDAGGTLHNQNGYFTAELNLSGTWLGVIPSGLDPWVDFAIARYDLHLWGIGMTQNCGSYSYCYTEALRTEGGTFIQGALPPSLITVNIPVLFGSAKELNYTLEVDSYSYVLSKSFSSGHFGEGAWAESTVDYSHTLSWGGITGVFDANGNAVSNFSVTSTSGFDYATTAPVPEPETYAMMLAGLGLLGFAARRRKLKEAAAA